MKYKKNNDLILGLSKGLISIDYLNILCHVFDLARVSLLREFNLNAGDRVSWHLINLRLSFDLANEITNPSLWTKINPQQEGYELGREKVIL
jgi:hypothetical protein